MIMSKTLVVYYSLEGHTRLIAEIISKELKADLLELKPLKDLVNKEKFSKYFWGGRQVLMKEKPELKPFNKNPDNYDLIIIGTPVWAWNYAPPIRTFFEKTDFKNKKIALFCSSSGSKGGTFINMKKQLKSNQVISEMEFLDKNTKEQNKLEARKWAKSIL